MYVYIDIYIYIYTHYDHIMYIHSIGVLLYYIRYLQTTRFLLPLFLDENPDSQKRLNGMEEILEGMVLLIVWSAVDIPQVLHLPSSWLPSTKLRSGKCWILWYCGNVEASMEIWRQSRPDRPPQSEPIWSQWKWQGWVDWLVSRRATARKSWSIVMQ